MALRTHARTHTLFYSNVGDNNSLQDCKPVKDVDTHRPLMHLCSAEVFADCTRWRRYLILHGLRTSADTCPSRCSTAALSDLWKGEQRRCFSAHCDLWPHGQLTLPSTPGLAVLTCGGCAQDHRLSPGHAQIPDPITVAHVLPEQLAQSPGPGGGLEAGHNLDKAGGPREGVYIFLQGFNWRQQLYVCFFGSSSTHISTVIQAHICLQQYYMSKCKGSACLCGVFCRPFFVHFQNCLLILDKIRNKRQFFF